MSVTSDNACGYDMEIATVDAGLDLSGGIGNLMQHFGDQTVKMIELQNRILGTDLAADQITFKQFLVEKMSLLFDLNKPQFDHKTSIVMQIDEIHCEIAQQLSALFMSESNYIRAYGQHCEDTIKTKMIIDIEVGFDEFTTMPHETLENCIIEKQRQQKEVKATCATMHDKRVVYQKEYEAKYNEIVKETEIFEKYDLEAQETFKLSKFELK